MYFVKTDDLKVGMRLARPIYNKNGVLLYERESKLTSQGILSIRNFRLIGIFVLEPAEPAPPMSEADLEFERFQTIYSFLIEEELNGIIKNNKAVKLSSIVSGIIKEYGHLDKKINFMQNLRSKEDYIYKHALNTAILCSIITNRMNLKIDERLETVTAAVSNDIGLFSLPAEVSDKIEPSEAENMQIFTAKIKGFEMLESVCDNGAAIKRLCTQAETAKYNYEKGTYDKHMKRGIGAKVLLVADTFERMTAMQFGKEPESEIKTIKYLQDNPDLYEEKVVDALIDSINLLIPGVSVELNIGQKALVLVENEEDILRPLILSFKDNSIMDLSSREYDDVEIVDVMKTMDNRYVMDIDALRQQGFAVPGEE